MTQQLAPLIQDLSIILITAAVSSLVFKKLKQPVILGYMFAGLLIGPHAHFFPNVTDVESIQVWAEMGVIFMLFSMGIEFSFGKLARLGATVLIAGVFEFTAMCLMGFMIGQFLGWSPLQSLFLGAMLSISSTSIIYKAFEEMKLKSKKFAQLVFGILVVEDLMAVLMIVLLTTLALSQQIEGTELAWTAGKLVFYLALWIVAGLFFIPWSLRTIRNLLNEETTLIISLALCLMMVVTATQVGFSAALGAFIMGSILGETDEKEKIERIFHPVKNLFSAIFFVSVGMLVNPETLINNPGLILLFTAVLIIGKIYYATLGSLIAGQNMQTSILAGISLAQIGEFSFIIAGLGLTLKVTDEALYSNIIAVSAITTFTTPYLVRSRERLATYVEKLIPLKIQNFLNQYLQFSNLVRASSEWQALVKSYFLKIFVNTVIVVAIFLLSSKLIYPMMQVKTPTIQLAQALTLILTLIVCSPFLWGIVMAKPRDRQLAHITEHEVTEPVHKLIFALRLIIALILVGSLLFQFVSILYVVVVAAVVSLAVSYSLARFLESVYIWLENRFLRQIDSNASVRATPYPVLAPWDAHLSEFEIQPESEVIGKSLVSLHLREKFGIIIAMIQRGKHHITAPGRDEILMPFDRVAVIGTDEQLANFEDFLIMLTPQKTEDVVTAASYSLDRFLVQEDSKFLGKQISQSGIREQTHGLVVGIERKGKRILNPDTHLTIQAGDLLWIVGHRQKIRELH
jgi:CPA2 family monovalent cation:H+ antiporter-2